MRVRTDGDYSHRERDIKRAAEHLDCSKTEAILTGARVLPRMDEAVRQVLQRDDLTLEQRQEIAETLSVSGGPDYRVENRVESEF